MDTNILHTLALCYAARPPRPGEDALGAAHIDGATVPYAAEPAYRRCLHREDGGYTLFLGGSPVGWARDQETADQRLRAILAAVVAEVAAGTDIAEALRTAVNGATDDRMDEQEYREIVRSWGG